VSDTDDQQNNVSGEPTGQADSETAVTEPFDVRWRLFDGTLPMRERHMRSLAAHGMGSPMQAWMRVRIEYMLENHAVENPDGVLHIVAGSDGSVKFSVEPLGETPRITEGDLVDGTTLTCGNVPGIVWVAQGDRLVAASEDALVSAASTTLRDLALTLHYDVDTKPVTLAQAKDDYAEIFVVSDEFGVLPVVGHEGEVGEKFAGLLARLWTKKD
jgi:hypothetical protein